MSDYFTNLVTRSFSPVAAVQPLGVSPYVMTRVENSFAEFSDPFAEAIHLSDEIPETEKATPERNSSRRKPARLDVAIEKTPVKSDQAVTAAPVANTRDDTITSSKPESPSDFAVFRGRHNPPPSDTQPELQDAPLKSESTTSRMKLRSSDNLSQPPTPIQEALSTVVSDRGPSQKKRFEESLSDPLEPTSATEGFPQEKPNRAKRVGGKAEIVEHVTEREPSDAGVSTWRRVKKSVKASPISPRTSVAHPTRPVISPADKLQPAHARENVAPQETVTVETVSEVSRSATPLIPKISTQSLLPVNIKSRQNVNSKQATYQSANRVLPEETIINVAIGRIEVRATPSESSKREHQLKGPRVMDLDEYARQRSRGNR